MANKVASVDVATKAFGGVALATPTTPLRPNWLPALRDMSSALVRTHLQRLPEAAPVVREEPLLQADLAPGFAKTGHASVGRGAITDICVSPRGGFVFVTNQSDDSVSQLDAETLAVVTTVTGTDEPFVVKTAGSRAYVSTVSALHDAVTVIDGKTGALVANHPLALSVRDMTISLDGRRVYVARTGRDGADVAVIDTVTDRVTTIDLGIRRESTAEAIAISRDGSRLYVATADHLGGELVAIDTSDQTVVGSAAFTTPIRDIAASHDGTAVFVAGYDTETGAHLDVVDTGDFGVIDSVAIGGTITQLLLSAEGDRMYLVNGDRVTVMCIATREIIDTIDIGAEPSCIAESRDGKRVFVADYDGRVTAFAVASSTELLLAKMMAPEALALPALRELEPARS
jgi:YVTN family beta-propeller protein